MGVSGATPDCGIRREGHEAEVRLADDAAESKHSTTEGSGMEIDHLPGMRQGMLGEATAALAAGWNVFGSSVYRMCTRKRR